MNLPVLLAQASTITEGSTVSLSLAYMVGGAVIVLAVGLAETRFRSSSHEKQLTAHEERFKEQDRVHKAALDAVQTKQQLMELHQAENKVVVSEVRSQLAAQAEGQREQTRMLHDLLGMMGRMSARRKEDKDAA